MAKTIKIGLLIVAFGTLAACSKVQKPLPSKDINRTIDSIVKAKLVDIHAQANDDLDHRMAIEVKAKVDSILAAQARPADAPKADTSKPATQPAAPHIFNHADTAHK